MTNPPEDGAPYCTATWALWRSDGATLRCLRPLGHLGRHQHWKPRAQATWSDDGGSSARILNPSEDDLSGDGDYACTRCGCMSGEEDLPYSPAGEQHCFHCSHWARLLQERTDRHLVIGGVHYVAGKSPGSAHSGFGGARWEVLTHDGRRIVTNDMWTQGEVPEEWRSEFPDNAAIA